MTECLWDGCVLVVLILVVAGLLGLPLFAQLIKGSSPESVTGKLMEATQARDAEAAKPYVTEKAWPVFSAGFDMQQTFTEFIVYQGEVNGTEASVPVHVTEGGNTQV